MMPTLSQALIIKAVGQGDRKIPCRYLAVSGFESITTRETKNAKSLRSTRYCSLQKDAKYMPSSPGQKARLIPVSLPILQHTYEDVPTSSILYFYLVLPLIYNLKSVSVEIII